MILRFPPNFVRQLSNKARRNYSNIGVAQVVAASWSNNQPAAAIAAEAAAAAASAEEEEVVLAVNGNGCCNNNNSSDVQIEVLTEVKYPSFVSSDGSLAIHAGERLGCGIVTDAITTPVVNTTAYFFNKTSELIDFKEKGRASFEYGRYGNPTTVVAEEKISALEGAESTLLLASGMCASTVLLMALVPAGGHIVTTTDCYQKTRIFIETVLPKMGIKATVIDPADMEALESALDENSFSLFFTESPTNPFLRCVDIELVSRLCHNKRTIVCIDGTFATPLNQKALALGADIVLHSATKYIAGHNDVLAGCISGSQELVSVVCNLHHILGGALNPNAAYLIIRGMKTLHLCVQQQNSTALGMAKILEAHLKVLAGCISGSQELVSVVCNLHHILGGALNPNAAYLIIRGMKTLHLCVQQQNSTALGMAKILEAHLKVKRVYYPGLLSHPEHHIATRQMTGFGGAVSFEVDGDLLTRAKFVDALKIPYIASSFGGCESIVDQPAIMSYWDLSQSDRAKYGIMDNLVRFSFGVEEFDDLKTDILQALETI